MAADHFWWSADHQDQLADQKIGWQGRKWFLGRETGPHPLFHPPSKENKVWFKPKPKGKQDKSPRDKARSRKPWKLVYEYKKWSTEGKVVHDHKKWSTNLCFLLDQGKKAWSKNQAKSRMLRGPETRRLAEGSGNRKLAYKREK